MTFPKAINILMAHDEHSLWHTLTNVTQLRNNLHEAIQENADTENTELYIFIINNLDE